MLSESFYIFATLQYLLTGRCFSLDAPNLRQLKQRVVQRCNLNPLQPEEAVGYIETRLARAGMPDQKIFSPELLEEIYKRSRGIPRVINLICDNLLVTAFAMEALPRIEAAAPSAPPPSTPPPKRANGSSPVPSVACPAASDPTAPAIVAAPLINGPPGPTQLVGFPANSPMVPA